MVETGVIQLLAGCPGHLKGGHVALNRRGTLWWSIETAAVALKGPLAGRLGREPDDDALENLVGLMLYTMAVDGRAVVQRNILLDGERRTIFALAPKSADVGE